MRFKGLIFLLLCAVLVTGPLSYAGKGKSCSKSLLSTPWLKQVEQRFRDTNYKPLFSTNTDYIASGEMYTDSRDYPQLNMRDRDRNGQVVEKADRFLFDNEYDQMIQLKQKIVEEGQGIDHVTIKSKKGVIKIHKNFEEQIFKSSSQLLKEIFNDLPVKYPDIFSGKKGKLIRLGDRTSWKLELNSAAENLKLLSEILVEDLVFTVRGDDGLFYLAGGVLAFPSRWSFQRLLGHSSMKIHNAMSRKRIGPSGMTLSELIEKELNEIVDTDKLTIRNNWALYTNPVFSQPDYGEYSLPTRGKTTIRNIKDRAYIRSEYETLSKLSNDVVLFSIRPYMFKLGQVVKVPNFPTKLLKALKKRYAAEYDAVPYYQLVVEYLEKTIMELGKPLMRRTRILKQQELTDDHTLIRLAKPKGMKKLTAGQPIKLEINTEEGIDLSRIFSLSNSPDENTIEVAITNSDSDFKSRFLNMERNERLNIQRVPGQFKHRKSYPAVMIASGIGITPFRSMIQEAIDHGIDKPITLVYGNRSQIPFEKELSKYEKQNDKFNIIHTLSRPGEAWQGRTGRIDTPLIKEVVEEASQDTRYYIVGNPQMVEDTLQNLELAGVPKNQIFIESFAGAVDSNTVCFCHQVSRAAITSAIEEGASCVADVAKKTKATTGCGQCKCDIEKMFK